LKTLYVQLKLSPLICNGTFYEACSIYRWNNARTDIGHDKFSFLKKIKKIAPTMIKWILPTAVLYCGSNAASISSKR